jgi:hypothetical protein
VADIATGVLGFQCCQSASQVHGISRMSMLLRSRREGAGGEAVEMKRKLGLKSARLDTGLGEGAAGAVESPDGNHSS